MNKGSFMDAYKVLLGEILIQRKRITREQLEAALQTQKKEGGYIGEILVRLGLLDERDIVVALVIQCGLPYIAEMCIRDRSKSMHFPLISRIKVISSLDIAEHRLPQDGRFRIVTSQHKEVDFRVNVLPTAMGEKIVLRVLDKNQDMADIDKLGFERDSLERLKDCCHKPHGMILACGPTGSGKTTTLYAILKYIDSPGRNIVAVEDPVERCV